MEGRGQQGLQAEYVKATQQDSVSKYTGNFQLEIYAKSIALFLKIKGQFLNLNWKNIILHKIQNGTCKI